MQFRYIFTIAAFVAIVAGVPLHSDVKAISPRIPCNFCDAMPLPVLYEKCWKHCNALMNFSDTTDLAVSNTTALALRPRDANTTSPAVLTYQYKNITSICDFCDDIPDGVYPECRVQCKQANSYIFAPFVINALWNYCMTGCEARGCGSAYLPICFDRCSICYHQAHYDSSDMAPLWELRPKAQKCFC